MLTLFRFAPAPIKNRYGYLWLAKLIALLDRGHKLSESLFFLALDKGLLPYVGLRINQYMADDVSNGIRLSTSLRHRAPNYFPNNFYTEIKTAEESGNFMKDLKSFVSKYDTKILSRPNLLYSIEEVIKDCKEGFDPRAKVCFDLDYGHFEIVHSPVARLIHMLLAQAIKEHADALFLTPENNIVKVEKQIDGRLEKMPSIPLAFAYDVFSRIDTLSGLEYWQAQKQTGQFKFCHFDFHSDVEATTEKTGAYKTACLKIIYRK